MKYFIVFIVYIVINLVSNAVMSEDVSLRAFNPDRIEIANRPTHTQRGFLDSTYEYAQQSLASVTRTLKDDFDSLFVKLNSFTNSIIRQNNEAIAAVQNKLNELVNKANKQIDNIIKAGEDAGNNISDCLNKIKLEEMRETTLMANEKRCLTDEVDDMKKIIVETKDIIYNASSILQNLPEEIHTCYVDSDIWGLKDAAQEALTLGISIPFQVTSKITTISKFVGGLTTRLEICAAIQVAEAGLESAKMISEVYKCVHNKD